MSVELIRQQALNAHYNEIGKLGKQTVTAKDESLRDLEIDYALEYIKNGDKLLDVGCGGAS